MMDAQGRPFTVRYDEVNAMLLTNSLKEHRTVQALKSAAAKQSDYRASAKQIEALVQPSERSTRQVEMSAPLRKRRGYH